MASPISSTIACSLCCTTETVTGSTVRAGTTSGDALEECIALGPGIEQQGAIDRTEVIHRLDEVVNVHVVEW